MFGRKKPIKKKKILVIEDDSLLANILINSIVREGFEAFNVLDGLQAIDTAKKLQPDLILLDLILPGLDGFEVLRQLKADNSLKKVPVFIITNLDSISDVRSAKVLGAEEYFIKANTNVKNIVKAVSNRLTK